MLAVIKHTYLKNSVMIEKKGWTGIIFSAGIDIEHWPELGEKHWKTSFLVQRLNHVGL